MPLPKRNKDEDAKNFVNRCMSSDVMKKEYPSQEQRVAVPDLLVSNHLFRLQ